MFSKKVETDSTPLFTQSVCRKPPPYGTTTDPGDERGGCDVIRTGRARFSDPYRSCGKQVFWHYSHKILSILFPSLTRATCTRIVFFFCLLINQAV